MATAVRAPARPCCSASNWWTSRRRKPSDPAIGHQAKPGASRVFIYDARMESASLPITPKLAIPRELLHFTFTRAGGPGGQNVNKRSTAVLLRVMAADLAALMPPQALARLRLLAGPA